MGGNVTDIVHHVTCIRCIYKLFWTNLSKSDRMYLEDRLIQLKNENRFNKDLNKLLNG
jgi:hypothetical protein